MGIYLEEQTMIFLESLMVGAALGMIYDAFRISRVAFNTARAVIFISDVIFFLICAIVTFFFGLTVIDGMLRGFLLIGELLGAVIYYFTLGKLVMGVSKKIIHIIKTIINFVKNKIFLPIWNIFYRITDLILKPFWLFSNFLKKKLQIAKFRLKVRRIVLYNQLSMLSQNNKRKKRRRNINNEETQTGNP